MRRVNPSVPQQKKKTKKRRLLALSGNSSAGSRPRNHYCGVISSSLTKEGRTRAGLTSGDRHYHRRYGPLSLCRCLWEFLYFILGPRARGGGTKGGGSSPSLRGIAGIAVSHYFGIGGVERSLESHWINLFSHNPEVLWV